jgi:excinuclease UvrABC nuclease subunit
MTLRLHIPQGDRTSAFAHLAAPPERIFVQEAGRAKRLPTCCGTYTFNDGAGELLYIGKAKNVRARVLSHFRESAPDPLLLLRWTHLVRRIEVRPAESEVEALLVKADLVGRLRPPFNRQMRSWSR